MHMLLLHRRSHAVAGVLISRKRPLCKPTCTTSGSTLPVCCAGTPIRMPARGSVTFAILPHMAPNVQWYTGIVATDFSPSADTPPWAFWQVLFLVPTKAVVTLS